MKNLWTALLVIISFSLSAQDQKALFGAWERTIVGKTKAIYTIADGFFSIATFNQNSFISTVGGSWTGDGAMNVTTKVEYASDDPDLVGKSTDVSMMLEGDKLMIDGSAWARVDAGGPGDLAGAWLISGRKQEGEMKPMIRGPRKTMKILSGTRFQWIAYNTDTREFMATGGGTYTTKDGVYTETIDFFSKDNSRVGAILPFEYEVKGDDWHHSGNSSKGDPIYEVWSKRTE